MPGSRAPNEAQQAWNNVHTDGMRKDGLRAARQIAKSRRFVYERQPVTCISCGFPRDRRSFPVCPLCCAKRKQGMR